MLGKKLSHSENDKTAIACRVAAAKYLHEQQQKRFEYGKLLKIAKLLLQRGAAPDAVHSSPLPEYTPLMLAVELDEPELV